MLTDLCNGVFIEFPEHILKVDLSFEGAVQLLTKAGEMVCAYDPPEGAGTPVQGYYLEWQDFLHQCRSRMPSLVSGATARTTTALIEQCYRHAQVSG